MIPPFLAATFAKPLLKWGIILGVILVLWLTYLGWKNYQQHLGKEAEHQKYQAELLHQAQESAIESAKQVTLLQRKVDEAIHERDAFRDQLAAAHQEIQTYAKFNKIQRINDDAVRIVNNFARMLNEQTTGERVPNTSGTSTESSVETKATPTTLDAFERLEELTARLGYCETNHRGLSEWAVEKYRAEVEFYNRELTP